MNKKMLVISLLSVFMLLAIAFTSTVTSNTQKPPKKESPLFRIRTRRVIREKIGNMMSRFVGDGVFFLPFQWLKYGGKLSIRQRFGDKHYASEGPTKCYVNTCLTECWLSIGCYTCDITYCPQVCPL